MGNETSLSLKISQRGGGGGSEGCIPLNPPPGSASEFNSLIIVPSMEKQRKTWFTYFGDVNILNLL